MIVGMSLPPVYLAGPGHARYTAALGEPEEALAALRRAGVAAVELRAIREDTAPELAREAALRVLAAGLELTVHARLPHPPAPLVLGPALRELCRALTRRGTPAVVTVHGYESAEETREALAEHTVHAARALLEDAERAGIPIRLALELNRKKSGLADPGTAYNDLLDLHARIDHPWLGFCWDLGHTFSNVCQGLLTLPPPEDFLRRVIHTHIHDLGPNGETHWPLTAGRLPLADCVGSLAATGYSGVLNLELEPNRYDPDTDLRAGIFASLERLVNIRDCIESVRDQIANPVTRLARRSDGSV